MIIQPLNGSSILFPTSTLPTAHGGPFEVGFDTLTKQMAYLSAEAQDYYKGLQARTQLSKKADELLDAYNREAAIQFLNDNYPKSPSWDSAVDEEIKAGLEAFKSSQSDFVSESQLQIQRTMQTYNTTATLFNSLQVLLADMNKMVAQSIR